MGSGGGSLDGPAAETRKSVPNAGLDSLSGGPAPSPASLRCLRPAPAAPSFAGRWRYLSGDSPVGTE